jgi:DNA-directed RNA polymerase subunit RPC12/RpoP
MERAQQDLRTEVSLLRAALRRIVQLGGFPYSQVYRAALDALDLKEITYQCATCGEKMGTATKEIRFGKAEPPGITCPECMKAWTSLGAPKQPPAQEKTCACGSQGPAYICWGCRVSK